MPLPLYQVDAFTGELFAGNPAAVCPLEHWLSDGQMQAIAQENNLSETAFFRAGGDGFTIRWFTPQTEVALCGHATLASAFVLFQCLNWPQPRIQFRTLRSGFLTVEKKGDLLVMDFPARPATPLAVPVGIAEALGIEPQVAFSSAEDLLVLLEDEAQLRSLAPDFAGLASLPYRGVIVTARGDEADFVSRFFAPKVGVPEDPVTGSSHCVLIPYWAKRLGKHTLKARQVSRRGGEVFCEDRGDRVGIAGRAVLYLRGMISL